jgi:hypothetical protein
MERFDPSSQEVPHATASAEAAGTPYCCNRFYRSTASARIGAFSTHQLDDVTDPIVSCFLERTPNRFD